MTRQDGRAYDELRPIKITTDFVKFAEGSCLIECGDTKVLCCASVEEKTPPHVAEGEGWVTAEYSMLPRANRERSKRDISKLKLSPRSAEIQRLVGRSLRAAVDLAKLGEHTITIDCDVLQGDGGTRTASVTGGFVALALACRKLVEEGKLSAGHARALVPLSPSLQESTANAIVSGGLSVRQTEALVKRLSAEKKEAQAKDPDEVDYLAEAQNELKARLCRGVKIVPGRKKGRIELEYYGVDDLNDLLDALAVIKVSQLKKGPQA